MTSSNQSSTSNAIDAISPVQSALPRLHPAFELVRQQDIDALTTRVYQFRHRVTGAVHYHLANRYDENVFMVAFRTQPMDSKGEAHILEHTALCGSQKYPVRDPFFSMIRRSLNTFMNAFTAADWTAYPFATQNKKDFDNLLSVYLDAAFFANLNELDFLQEGIRVELENDKPVFKGIVFNEMKGAMSAPTDRLYHQLAHHLYPTTTYHYNSGGDPAHIPDLTYDELVAFYRTHYHPSNAVFMTFGDADVYELHDKIESQALQHFNAGTTLYSQPEQRLTAPVRCIEAYPVDDSDLSHKSYHVLAWLLPETNDTVLRLGMRLVEGVLLENAASPLRHYLDTCKLGQSSGPLMGVDDSHFEMAFYCGLQGSDPQHADAFEAGVLRVLETVASSPIDENVINAILHQIELHQREIGGDGAPYGLSLMFNGMNSAIHHGDPVAVWDVDQALAAVREHLADPGWLPGLIRTHLLDNPHRVRLTLQPDNTLSGQEQAAEQQRLDQLAALLTDDQRRAIEQQTQALKARQAEVDDINLLPKVGLEDVPLSLRQVPEVLTQLSIQGQQETLHLYPAGTNGLYYQQVIMRVPDQVLWSPYLGILNLLMGEVGAGDLDYLQLQVRQTEISGGLGMGLSLRSDVHDKHKISGVLSLTTKALTRHPDAMDLLYQAFNQIRFDEKSRILELLQQRKLNWQARIAGSGHSYAMQSASRNHSALARRDYEVGGLNALKWLGELIQQISQDDQAFDDFIGELKSLHQQLIISPKEWLLVCEPQHANQLTTHLAQVWSQVAPATITELHHFTPEVDDNQDIAWLIQTNVQCCASSYPAVAVDHDDAAALMILGGYLRNGYLHGAIREQGGAYGGGATYDGNACAFRFYSYRDPRLSETFEDFEQSIDWLLNTPQADHALEEAILGVIASMDKPASPAGEAISDCYAALHGRTHAFRQHLRERLLRVTLEDLQAVTRRYLVDVSPVRAVVAPFNRQDELSAMGFEIHRIAAEG